MVNSEKEEKLKEPIRIEKQSLDRDAISFMREIKKYYADAVNQSAENVEKNREKVGRVPFPWERKAVLNTT